MGFLFGRAKGVDHGADHREAEGHQADTVGARGFFGPNETLRRRPAGAAIFDRPSGRDPALLVQNLVPDEEVFLGQLLAFILLPAQFGGVIFGDEVAHFLLEGEIFGAEFHVHHESPIGQWRPYNGRSPLRKRQVATCNWPYPDDCAERRGLSSLCGRAARRPPQMKTAPGKPGAVLSIPSGLQSIRRPATCPACAVRNPMRHGVREVGLRDRPSRG